MCVNYDRLGNLNLESLERRRLPYDLVFCYKILCYHVVIVVVII